MGVESAQNAKGRELDPTITFPAELPITARVEEIAQALLANQVIVVAGETGSGKSTQLPKIALAAGLTNTGRVAHTQPRRIAARAVAERVAEELGTTIGDKVGFAIRFHDQVGPNTQIKVMTDGLLVAQLQRDKLLKEYSVIIVDEAHERSLNIDVLLGYLKQLLPKRPDLRVIITSATIDTARFAEHFDDAPVIEVSGRTYPVTIRYDEPEDGVDQATAICEAAETLLEETTGDILVFCSGEREIRDAEEALSDYFATQNLRGVGPEILPLFGRLSSADQHRVFQRSKRRRIVLATNVAETSITVPKIGSVIDPGVARISRFSKRSKVQRLPIEKISQASANQRSGRCGRIGPGICIRLYSEADFESREEFTDPEIRRTNLASVILLLASQNLGHIEDFPFLDPPDQRSIRASIALLEELGAVEPEEAGTTRWLTKVGRRLARIPTDPRLARMLIEADRCGALNEVLIIAAALSIQDPREFPAAHLGEAQASHNRFRHEHSDFLTLLNLWNYLSEERTQRSGSQFRKMCTAEFLHYLRIREWQDLVSQLRRTLRDLKMTAPDSAPTEDAIHQALLAGLLGHIGRREPDHRSKAKGERPQQGRYQGTRGTTFRIGRTSALSKATRQWVMAAELVETDQIWARVAAPIQPHWIEPLAQHLLRFSYGEPTWDESRGLAMVSERVTLLGLTIHEGRNVPYRRVDRPDARLFFIEMALLERAWDRDYEFLDNNAAQVAAVEALIARERQGVDLDTRERMADFYRGRLPESVTSTSEFDRWWTKARRDQSGLLSITTAELTQGIDLDPDEDAFPTSLNSSGAEWEIEYRFDPSHPFDGAMLKVPIGQLNLLRSADLVGLVPGHREALLEALVRSLPKSTRRALGPAPQVAQLAMEALPTDNADLLSAAREALARIAAVPISIDEFDLSKIPPHLVPTICVLNDNGEPLAVGKDLTDLRSQLDRHLREAVADAHGGQKHIHGMTTPTFGELKRSITIERNGLNVVGYPCLVDEETGVGVMLATSAEEQLENGWAGTRRFLMMASSSLRRDLRRRLTNAQQLQLAASPWGSDVAFISDLFESACDLLIGERGGPVFSQKEMSDLNRSGCAALGELTAGRLPVALGVVGAADAIGKDLRARTAAALRPSLADIADQANRLLYRGCLTGAGWDRHEDLFRYAVGMEHRLATLASRVDRDRDLTKRCQVLDLDIDRLAARGAETAVIEDLTWQMEELRLSLFAQTVGARSKVSEAKIRAAIAAQQTIG